MFNELLLLWATWGQTPVYWAVAKAKGQISPAINATKPAHMHTAVLVYSSYLCGIRRHDMILCRNLTARFILDVITCGGIYEHSQFWRNGILMMLWVVFRGGGGGQVKVASRLFVMKPNALSLSALLAPILSLHHSSCLLKGIFSSMEKESDTHRARRKPSLLWHRVGNTAERCLQRVEATFFDIVA